MYKTLVLIAYSFQGLQSESNKGNCSDYALFLSLRWKRTSYVQLLQIYLTMVTWLVLYNAILHNTFANIIEINQVTQNIKL
jgi:hypothetical protein